MLKKSFTLASAVSLAGMAVWISGTTACGGSEDNNASSSSSTSSTSGGAGDGGGSTTSSSSSTSSTSSSGSNPTGGVDPATVPGVAITFGKCAPFTKCDGSIAGEWEIAGGCLADTTFDQFKDACPGFAVENVVIKASGTIKADAAKVSRTSKVFVSADFDITKAQCQALAIIGGCSAVPGLLKSGASGPKFSFAECTDSETSCLCRGQISVDDNTTDDSYATDGAGTLTTKGTGTPAERTFDYCPKGTSLTYTETTAKNATFGMFIEIKKK